MEDKDLEKLKKEIELSAKEIIIKKEADNNRLYMFKTLSIIEVILILISIIMNHLNINNDIVLMTWIIITLLTPAIDEILLFKYSIKIRKMLDEN